MAGHSKWANIKHRKGAQDKKRAKLFTRLLKEIHVAVKEGGGGDIDSNPRLRLAVQNAKGANVPKDTIERAITKASGEGSESYSEVSYEGYIPNGVAVFVECTTDNLNRTVSHIRAIFSKSGGELGTNGSLEFIFDRKGVFVLEKEGVRDWDREELEMELIDGGLEEMDMDDEFLTIFTSYEDFGAMNQRLEEMGLEIKSAELQRIPNSTLELSLDQARTAIKAIERFEDDEDVNNVYHNVELTDELMQELESS
jgi:YebC/PmpR family DNA-binding regulatory protein